MADPRDIGLGETLPASTQDTVPAGPRGLPRFQAGQRVANRYEIVRFIAAGGMGEVYEARDGELDVAVALKTIRSERTDQRALDYFRREIQVARKITHPSVCRIFDVGFHESTTFLTMELLAGETLADLLRRTGKLAPGDALPIVLQICAALTAAHDAGVVHRDLKSQNIMLVGKRAVVMDFGLARPAADASADVKSSDTADLVGTPHYMAPEQIVGASPTAAVDIYALGVVMFEMVTAELPFDGPTPMAIVAKRLADAAPSPRTKVPDLDPRWTRAIERCLEREAGDRPASAAAVAEALAAEVRPRRRWPAAVAVVAACAGGYALYALRPHAEHAAPRTLAVLGFANAAHRGDSDWLATALGELFDAELAVGTLRVVPSETVARARIELAVTDPGALDDATLAKIRTDLGVDAVVFGSFSDADASGIQLTIQLAESGARRTITVRGPLPDVADQAGARLRSELGIQAVPGAGAVRGVLPADAVAARAYSEGLARLRAFNPLGARDRLAAAVTAEPAYPLAHAALARALSELGDDDRARDEARLALDHAEHLPARALHEVRARFFETTAAWGKAVEEYRALAAEQPADLAVGLALARAQARAGDPDGAFATLATLRALPGAAGRDPQIDLAEVDAAGERNDFHREQEAAARAAERARAIGALLLVGQARRKEAQASRRLGDGARADRAFAEARTVFEQMHYRSGLANIHVDLANDLIDRGDLAGARREAEAALAEYQALGDRNGQEHAYATLGEILQNTGDLAGAFASYEQSLASARAIDSKSKQAGALLNLGIVLLHQGDADGAQRSIEEALPTFTARHMGYAQGEALGMLGLVARFRGELSQARERLADAYATLRAAGVRADAAEIEIWSADLARISGDLAGARKQLADAQADCRELALARLSASADVVAARIALDAGELADAERIARDAAARFAADGARDDEGSARALLAIVLAAAGRDARDELARAQELAQASQAATLRIAVALAAARVHRSEPELRALVAAPATPFELRLEARLALARLGSDRAGLDALARDAGAAGFQTIADSARRR